MKLIGIAGGSGAGKSTVSYALVDAKPAIFEVINLDDYHKLSSEPDLPMAKGMINWDHPDIIDWEKLMKDIEKLKNNQPVTIDVWAHRSNPDYATTHQRISRTIYPKSILIIEGYLALYALALRQLFDKSYFLDLDENTRQARRDKNQIINNPDYEQKVLLPMHSLYVEPTKKYADAIIDVSHASTDNITRKICNDLGV